MRSSELYLGHPELMTEEQEESDFVDAEAEVGTFPTWYARALLSTIMSPSTSGANEKGKETFLERMPALGFSREEIASFRQHAQDPRLLSVQRRILFRSMQNAMLSNLISCSGAGTVEELFLLLKTELEAGVAAVIPPWYVFEGADERGCGYHPCGARGCFKTETLETRFGGCGGCRVVYYCGTQCQKRDWIERHKHLCAETKRMTTEEDKMRYFLQMLEDPNMRTAALGKRNK